LLFGEQHDNMHVVWLYTNSISPNQALLCHVILKQI